MKRLPLFVTVLAVVLLSASLAYWGLQSFKPPQRAIAAAPAQPAPALNIDAAKGLFGGQIMVAAVSNYQLKGVVAARGADSSAILSVDNKPAVSVAVGKEVAPGVTVHEVHPKYALLSEGGVIKRVDLPSDAGVSSVPASMPGQYSPPPPQQQQQQQPQQQPPQQQPQPPVQSVQPVQSQSSQSVQPIPMQALPAQQPSRPGMAPMGIPPIPGNNRQ